MKAKHFLYTGFILLVIGFIGIIVYNFLNSFIHGIITITIGGAVVSVIGVILYSEDFRRNSSD